MLRHVQRDDLPTWDPSKDTVDPVSTSKYLVFTRLFTVWSDPPQNCASGNYPLAIKQWRWLDDATAELTLKEGIRFHNKPPVNGRELVAGDFAAAFQRYKDNLVRQKPYSGMVDSITATSKYTFRLKLVAPWGGLMDSLLNGIYAPWIEAAESGGPDGSWWNNPEKSWIGSGPFMFERWRPGVGWSFVRNPDYFVPGQPYVDRVEYLIIPDVSTVLAAMRSGQINLARDLVPSFIKDVERTVRGTQTARCPGLIGSGFGYFGMDNSGPPFNDIRVRRAVAMAISHQLIIDKLYDGWARRVPILSPGAPYAMAVEDFPPEARQYLEYHPDRSRALLAEAGYAKGLDTTLNFSSRFAAPAPQVAEAMAEMLNEVGIRVKLAMHDYSRWVILVLQMKYQAGEMAASPATHNTAEEAHALNLYYSKGARATSRVNAPQYDALYDRFVRSRDETERKDLARKMQIMAAENAYAVMMPFNDSSMTGLPGVHFVWPGNVRDYGMLMSTAWIER